MPANPDNSLPHLVLIPGMMCDHRLWRHQIEHFSTEYQIHVPEIGKHNTIEEVAQTIIDSLPECSFAVAGLSMGGIILMELLRVCPERISSCILMDTNHRAEIMSRQKSRKREIEEVMNGGLRDIMITRMKPAYMLPGHVYPQEFLDLILDMALQQGNEVFANQSVALRDRRDYTQTMQQVSCPTLILYGEKDLLCPPFRHQEMFGLLADNITKDIVEIKDSGHLTPLEQPDAVNIAIRNWLIK